MLGPLRIMGWPAFAIGIVRHAQPIKEQQPEKAAKGKHPFQRRRSFQAHEQNEQNGGLNRRDCELRHRRADAYAKEGGPSAQSRQGEQDSPCEDERQRPGAPGVNVWSDSHERPTR